MSRSAHDMEIRQARPGDAVGLHRCKPARSRLEIDHQLEWILRERAPGRLGHFFAVIAGEVVGTVCLIPAGARVVVEQDRYSLVLPRALSPAGALEDWFVDPRYWSQGVGTALARRVLAEATRWGLQSVEARTPNPAGRAALERAGFHQTGDALEYRLVPGG